MSQRPSLRIDYALILLLVVLTVLFRSYKITSPLIEFHSWRQADTAAVARNFVRSGLDMLHPVYDDISPQQTGINNPRGYRMVEFPLYNAAIALSFGISRIGDIVLWGRIVNIIASLVILTCIYWIARREGGRVAGLISGLIFATYPFFVFYTRAILPETMATMWAFLSITLLSLRRDRVSYVLALVCFALALLVKPTAIFYMIAVIYVLVQRTNLSVRSLLPHLCAFALTLVPLGLWRISIARYPEGIPASAWLLTSVSTGGAMYSIFFRPAFFRWIFYERLNVLILGSYSFMLFVVSLLAKTRSLLPLSLFASALVYLMTFQGGNVQHEYYQIIILPVVALGVGLGASHLVKTSHGIVSRSFAYGIIVLAFCAGWAISWDKVKHYYYSLSDIPKFAKIVQSFTTPHDRIIVDTGGDTTALYAFDRKGSPGIYASLAQMKQDGGYSYLFTYNHQTADSIEKEDPTIRRIFENDRFVLFKL